MDKYLGLLEAGVDARLEIAEIAEDALLELFHILDGATKGLEAEDEGTDDVSAGDMIESAP